RVLTIDRPERRNALNNAMRGDLCALLRTAEQDDGVRCVILTGADPIFTAGVDFKDVGGKPLPVNPAQVMRGMRTPVVCAVNGPCVSGGLEIALSATFVVASEHARFADTHARLNVVPAWGLTALLPRAVGLRMARELSTTGNFVDAQEALRIGLVNHVVSHEDLMPYTAHLVGEIADTPAASEILSLYD